MLGFLGLSPLSWVLLIPAVLCWPIVFFIGWWFWRWSKKHEDAAEVERERLLEAAAARTPPAPRADGPQS